jgi:hypothetical protein
MRLNKLWSWVGGDRKPAAGRRSKNRSGVRFSPALTRLEERTVLNGYMAIGAGPGSPPLVAIRVDIQDQVGGSGPNGAGSPAAPRSDGKTDFTSQIFLAYGATFRGGVNVATGNFDGNPLTPDSLVTAPKAGGGPHIIVWNTKQNADGTIVVTGIKQQFMAFDSRFFGGVNIATGDLDGDGKAELIVAAGPGGGPHVKIYTPDANGFLHLVDQFYAYSPIFHGGVSLASGQGYNTPVQVLQDVAALPQRTTPYPPGVTVPGAAQGIPLTGFDPLTFSPAITVGGGNLQYLSANFLNDYGQIAYRPDIAHNPNAGQIVYANWADTTAMSNYPTDGSNPPTMVSVGPYVRVGTAADGTAIITRFTPPTGELSTRNQLVTGAGPGGGPDVRVWTFTGTGATLTHALAKSFYAFDPSFHGGVNVAIADVIANPVPTSLGGNRVVEPLDVTQLNAELTGNSSIATTTFPFDTNNFRAYAPSIIVGMASFGGLARIFSDYRPLVTDPSNPFTDPAPMQRTSVFQVDLVPALIDRGVIQDLSNPINNFTSLGSTTFFNRAIDPQWAGGLNPAWSAFTFDGSGSTVSVGSNLFTGVPGVPVNPALAQTVFAAGSAAPPLFGRGSHIRIFNQMSEIDITTGLPPSVSLPTSFNPIDDFFGFNSFTGSGVTAAFGFGALPQPTLDQISVSTPLTITTVSNPILVS